MVTTLDAKAPAAAPDSELLELLPPDATDTDPPTARAWNLPVVFARAVMSPPAFTTEASMKARTWSALPRPSSLIATDTPIDSARVALALLSPVPQATETAPACEKTWVPSSAVRETPPTVAVTVLNVMNDWVSRLTVLVDAAPARPTLLVLPRATAPPIENASTMVLAVAASVMSPVVVTLAWLT